MAALALFGMVSARATGPASCSVKVRSTQVIVLICTPDAGDPVWRVRSQAACADQSRCNVWIWDEPAKAPELAPGSDAAIPKYQADAAVAVWINESQTLIRLQARR
jgi:hypothetical protein